MNYVSCLIIVMLLATAPCFVQAQSLDALRRVQDEKWTSYQTDLKAAKARFEQDPSSLDKRFELARVLEKIGVFKRAQNLKTDVYFPYADGYNKALNLARNDLDSGPKILVFGGLWRPLGIKTQSELMDAVKRIKVISREEQKELDSLRDPQEVAERIYEDDDKEKRGWPHRHSGKAYLQTARAWYEYLVKQQPVNVEWQRAFALSYIAQGPRRQSNVQANIAYYQPALNILLSLAKAHPNNTNYLRDLAELNNAIGKSEISTYISGIPDAWNQEFEIRKKLIDKDDNNTIWLSDMADMLEETADHCFRIGLRNKGRDALIDVVSLRTNLLKMQPHNMLLQNNLIRADFETFKAMENRHILSENSTILSGYQDVLKRRTLLLESDPSNVQWQRNLVEVHLAIASFYGRSSDDADELASYVIAVKQMERYASLYPNDRGWLFYQLEFYNSIGGKQSQEMRVTRPYGGQEIAFGGPRNPNAEKYSAASKSVDATYQKMLQIIYKLADKNS